MMISRREMGTGCPPVGLLFRLSLPPGLPHLKFFDTCLESISISLTYYTT